MRALHLLLAGLILAALVVGLWFFLDEPGSAVRAGRAAEEAQRTNAAASLVASASAADSVSEDAARRVLEASSPASGAAPTPDAAPRKPRIVGRVVTSSGAPVAGATVLEAKGAEWYAPIPLDIESDAVPRGWLEVHRTETAADGTYFFEDVPAGGVRLVARAGGYAPRYEDRFTIKGKGEETLPDLVLAPGVVLAGKVQDRSGKPIAGAQILQSADQLSGARAVSVPGRGIPLATSDESGAFRVDQIASGPWCLLIEAPGFLAREERGRTERAGEVAGPLVIVLEPGQEIRGHVRGDGRPAVVRISARPARAEGAPEETEELAADAAPPDVNQLRARHGLVDAEGNFVIAGLKPLANYRLSASVPATEPGRWKRVGAIDGVTALAGQRGVEIEWKPEASITFQVVDAQTRAPLTELVVWAGVGRERTLRDDKGEPLKSFAEGRVRCGELRPQGGKPVQLRVRAAGYKDFEKKDVNLASGATLDLGVIELARERALDVHVVEDSSGADVRDASVVLSLQSEEQLSNLLGDDAGRDVVGDAKAWSARTDAHGRARLSSAPGKSVVIAAMAKGFLACEPVRVLLPEDADHSLELRLKRGGTVVVRVTDAQGRAVKGVGIAHKKPRDDSDDPGDDGGWVSLTAEKKTDAEGVARFENQRPGVHKFLLHDEAGETWINAQDQQRPPPVWTERGVVEGATVELVFVAAPRGGLGGRVREAGQPLEGARLHLARVRQGDEPEGESWGGPQDPFSTSTDHDGLYRYEDVRCGEYWLSVHHAQRRMSARFFVRITEDSRPFDIDLDMASVEGTVTDVEGHPVPGVEVSVVTSDDSGSEDSPYEIVVREDERGNPQTQYRAPSRTSERTDARGHYALRGLRSGVALSVTVSSDMLEPASSPEMTLQPDEARSGVDFHLRRAGVITVALTGTIPGNRGWYEVRAARLDPAPASPEASNGGANGSREQVVQTTWIGSWNRNATLRGLAPGRYRVSLRRPEQPAAGPDGQAAALPSQEVEVRAQETTAISLAAY